MTQDRDRDIHQRLEQALPTNGVRSRIEACSDSIDSISLLKDAAKDICALAEKHQQNSLILLSLLRDLEQIHRRIRVDYFESALPQTRNDLYKFIRDIEEKGGWPYIERMRLQDLLKNLEPGDLTTNTVKEKSEPD